MTTIDYGPIVKPVIVVAAIVTGWICAISTWRIGLTLVSIALFVASAVATLLYAHAL